MNGGGRRLSILIYHRVLREADPLQPNIPTARLFERHMRWLRCVFNILPLAEAVYRLQNGTLPSRAAAITFDDGYLDNYELALPILRRVGLPATFFIATGFLDGGLMWNDMVIESVRRCSSGRISLRTPDIEPLEISDDESKRAAISQLLPALKHLPLDERQSAAEELSRACGGAIASLMMTSSQVVELHRAGMEIGGHTVNHPILAVLNEEEARWEIEQGKRDLESLLQSPVSLFAYPNGRLGEDYGPEHRRIAAKAGFTAAMATTWGVAGPDTDRYQLPRFTPWDRNPLRYVARLQRLRLGRPH